MLGLQGKSEGAQGLALIPSVAQQCAEASSQRPWRLGLLLLREEVERLTKLGQAIPYALEPHMHSSLGLSSFHFYFYFVSDSALFCILSLY